MNLLIRAAIVLALSSSDWAIALEVIDLNRVACESRAKELKIEAAKLSKYLAECEASARTTKIKLPYEDDNFSPGFGVTGESLNLRARVGECTCTYRRGSTPPSSCSDARCGPVRSSR